VPELFGKSNELRQLTELTFHKATASTHSYHDAWFQGAPVQTTIPTVVRQRN